ncbi:MAG: amidohydrolase family protein, partial [Longicatena sp.]
FQFLYKEAQYDLMDCIRLCSTNAAKILKSYTTEIGLGKKVNLVILDHNLQIKDVIINGKSVL